MRGFGRKVVFFPTLHSSFVLCLEGPAQLLSLSATVHSKVTFGKLSLPPHHKQAFLLNFQGSSTVRHTIPKIDSQVYALNISPTCNSLCRIPQQLSTQPVPLPFPLYHFNLHSLHLPLLLGLDLSTFSVSTLSSAQLLKHHILCYHSTLQEFQGFSWSLENVHQCGGNGQVEGYDFQLEDE